MSPSTKIICPSCDKALLFRGPSPEGMAFKCPGCATVFRVPSLDRTGSPTNEEDEMPVPRQRTARMTPPVDAIADTRDRLAARQRREEESSEETEDNRARPRRRKAKKSSTLLIVGLVGGGLFLLLICTGVVGALVYKFASVSWQDFSPPGGRFTARFPGKPKPQTQQAAGQTVQMYIAELGWGQFAYSVAYNELNVDAEAMGANVVLDGAARGMGGTIKSQRDIRHKGHPGKEVTVEMQQNGVTMVLTNRIYVVKTRMYQIIVAGVKGKEPPASYAQFLDSFSVQE
jgi:hypothetical protein